MNSIDKVLDIARSQIGVTEFPANSNNVKYNTTYYGQPVYDGLWGCNFPWCVVFLWWCFRAADMSDLFYGGGRTANCGTLADYYMERGQFVTSGYKKGDIVFFDFGSEFQHVGIIEKVNGDGTYTTIEGNTSTYGSQDNGGAVCRKVRLLMNICGAGRPNYEEDDTMTDKEIFEAYNRYATAREIPSGMKAEYEEAKEMGITDGSRPMGVCTRIESTLMTFRAIKKMLKK